MYPENVTFSSTALYQAQRFPESATQTIALASSQVAPNGNVLPILTLTVPLLLTSTPTIIAGMPGQVITLVNVGSLPIGFQDASAIASTLRLLGGNMVVLRQYQSITLVYDSTLAAWVQMQAFNPPQLQNFFKDTPPNTANTMDDEFDDSSGMSGTVNGLNARWTWRNQGTAALTYTTQGWLKMTAPASATDNYRIIEQTAPAGNYTIDARITADGPFTNDFKAGLAMIDGTNGDFYFFGFNYNTGVIADGLGLVVFRNTNVTTFLSTTASTRIIANALYLRINYVSSTTTFNLWYSMDGVGWIRSASFVDAVVHTKVGLALDDTSNTGLPTLYCDFFRRSA